jgi:hypothetical protein
LIPAVSKVPPGKSNPLRGLIQLLHRLRELSHDCNLSCRQAKQREAGEKQAMKNSTTKTKITFGGGPSLNDVPDELLVEIFGHVAVLGDPVETWDYMKVRLLNSEELKSLCLTSKRFARIAQPLLFSHWAFAGKAVYANKHEPYSYEELVWRGINYEEYQARPKEKAYNQDANDILRYLNVLRTRPDLAAAVKEVTIGNIDGYHTNIRDAHVAKDEAEELVRDMQERVTMPETKWLCKNVEEGDPDALLALVLAWLPNLEVLRVMHYHEVHRYCFDDDYIPSWTWYLVYGTVNGKMSPAFHGFHKLRLVDIWAGPGCPNTLPRVDRGGQLRGPRTFMVDSMTPEFLRVESLHEIRLHYADYTIKVTSDGDRPEPRWPVRTSRAKVLRLHGCTLPEDDINGDFVSDVFGSFEMLETVEVDFNNWEGNILFSQGQMQGIDYLMTGLEMHKDSLTTLILHAGMFGDETMEAMAEADEVVEIDWLQQLDNLRSLSVSCYLLAMCRNIHDHTGLIDWLPPSLKYFKISGYGWYQNVIPLLHYSAATAAENLPEMRYIDLTDWNSSEMNADWKVRSLQEEVHEELDTVDADSLKRAFAKSSPGIALMYHEKSNWGMRQMDVNHAETMPQSI